MNFRRLTDLSKDFLRQSAVVAGLGVLMAAGVPAPAPSLPAAPTAPSAAAPTAWPGITKPSEDRHLSLSKMDVIWEVLVKPGDMVTKGQLLLKQDQREQIKNMQIVQVEAESQAPINAVQSIVDASKATKENKQVEYDRQKQMTERGVGNPSDLDKTRLDVVIADYEIVKAIEDLQKAKDEHQQRVIQVEREKATLERMEIRSPIDGIVEEITLKEGEVVDPQKPVITVVKIDVLWVEVFIPVNYSLKMKLGQQLSVTYASGVDTKPHSAKVILLSPRADPSAAVQKVLLEMPNPASEAYPVGLPAGLQVTVSLPDAGGVAAGK